MKVPQKREKALVFCSREICYMSGNFFAHQIGAAFEELGLDTEICELSGDDDLDEKLTAYMGQSYRVILDFNSKLPRMALEDGTSYLDTLDGPFFDYILDHPLFHYNGLTGSASNLHVLVLDEAQQRYVEAYYPKVASVHMLPLGATKALYGGEKERECRILFPGTFDSPDTVYELVKKAEEPFGSMMKELIELRIAEPLLPMEEAFRVYLTRNPGVKEQLAAGSESWLALAMNAMYPVDAYVRDYFRKAAVDELLAAGIPVTVIGEGWEKYRHAKEETLRREKGVLFALSFERIARAHILLNSAPIFNHGMHDRIPAGMANRAVVLTDGNPYLKKRFTDGKDICFYVPDVPGSLSGQAERLLENAALRAEIAEEAYRKYEAGHTWQHRAGELLAIADALE